MFLWQSPTVKAYAVHQPHNMLARNIPPWSESVGLIWPHGPLWFSHGPPWFSHGALWFSNGSRRFPSGPLAAVLTARAIANFPLRPQTSLGMVTFVLCSECVRHCNWMNTLAWSPCGNGACWRNSHFDNGKGPEAMDTTCYQPYLHNPNEWHPASLGKRFAGQSATNRLPVPSCHEGISPGQNHYKTNSTTT